MSCIHTPLIYVSHGSYGSCTWWWSACSVVGPHLYSRTLAAYTHAYTCDDWIFGLHSRYRTRETSESLGRLHYQEARSKCCGALRVTSAALRLSVFRSRLCRWFSIEPKIDSPPPKAHDSWLSLNNYLRYKMKFYASCVVLTSMNGLGKMKPQWTASRGPEALASHSDCSI